MYKHRAWDMLNGIGGIIFPVCIFVVVIFITYGFNSYKCSVDATGLGLPYTYGPVQGCMVKINDRQRVDINRVRITSDGDITVGSDNE